MRSPTAQTIAIFLLAGVLVAVVAVGLLVPRLTVSSTSAAKEAEIVAAAVDGPRRARSSTLAQPAARADSIENARTREPGGALLAVSRMPRSAELVLVIENGAELRASRLGAAASRFFVDAKGLAQSRSAWSALAVQLGWSESELFDRLLGRRVVLVARPSKDRATMLWALLSDISMETDTRLKERLEASQRSIDQGHQVLSIEKGRFEITSHRHAPTPGSRAEKRMLSEGAQPDVTIVLGPTGQSELFDEMVSFLTAGAPEPLGGADVIDAARSVGDAEILLIARLRGADPKPHDESAGIPATAIAPWSGESGFFVFAGRRGADADGSALEAGVVYRDHARRAENLAVPLTSDAIFRSLTEGSLLTVLQAAPLHGILGVPSSALDFLRELPKNLPEPARAALGTRQAFALRRVEQLNPGSSGQVVSGTPAPARVAAVLALESTSTADLARTLDGSIAGFVHNTLEQSSGLVQPMPYNFAGEMPETTRVLPIRMGEGNLLRLISPEPLALAWSFPRSRPDSEERAPATEGGDDTAAAGWWVVDIAPRPSGQEHLPADLHRAAVKAIVDASPSEPRQRWVWLASARPIELEALLPSLVPDLGGFRSAMKRFEDAEVKLSISEIGDIRGDIKLRLGQ